VSPAALYPLVRPLLFALDAEKAHELTLGNLRRAHDLGLGALARQSIADDPRTLMGLRFPNAVGLAAGLDKDGRYIAALGALGFGFIEVGTVTPRPQAGNPRPRMFRLPASKAIINRMGFNNGGLQAFLENVAAADFKGVLGLNIGKNADTPLERAADDYLTCLKGVYPHASYVSINVSSPNTKNLRQLQNTEALGALLTQLKAEQARLAQEHGRYVPLVLKIAPDLEGDAVRELARVARDHAVDGLIATNTTLARTGVTRQMHAEEAGGLSGTPLLARSNQVIRTLSEELGRAIPIIGVGGILTGQDARSKIDAGATLVQLYTGLVYRGPELIAECVRALRA
jgi:dihydroorotate dehydrogenase